MLINEIKPQLMPFQYPWAWEEFKNLCKNHWLPQEISMASDIVQWKGQHYLTNDERHLIKKILSFLVKFRWLFTYGQEYIYHRCAQGAEET